MKNKLKDIAKVAGSVSRSMLIERWRYAEYPGDNGSAMLFDENADLHEMKNLAADPAQASVVAEMKALLQTLPAGK